MYIFEVTGISKATVSCRTFDSQIQTRHKHTKTLSTYSIKDLEHLSGIKAHTIRIWEQRYDLLKPKRTDTNIRYYDDNDLKLVMNISLLKENGQKISKIAKMTVTEMNQEVLRITEDNIRYPDQINALTIAMIDLNEERFEKIIATNTLKIGFEKTMINIIYPFLTKIGLLWLTGTINPAQEHFITCLIRQKIIVAIDGQFANIKEDAPKYLLFLPEGEMHEISLLFSWYMLKARQNRVVYLGQNLPFEDLKQVHEYHNPDYLFTIITTSPGQSGIQKYINKLSEAFPDSEVLLTGYQVVGQDLQFPSNTHLFNRVDELIGFIDEHTNTV